MDCVQSLHADVTWPPRRAAGARARQLHRRPVRRSAARRLRRRGDQGRAARRRRPDAAVGRHARRRQPLVAGDRAATSARSRSTCATTEAGPSSRALAAAVRRRARELPARDARRLGPRLRRRCRAAQPAARHGAHQRASARPARAPAQAGFGSVGEAMGGIRHTTGSPDRPPARAGISLGDALASVFARDRHAAGARRARAQPGAGQEVDVAIYEAVAALMESTMADYELGGVVRTRTGQRAARAWRRRTCTRPPTAPRS